MRSKVVGVKGYWVEVKPLITSDLKSGNFVPVLEILFNCAKAFRFLVVDGEDENVWGRRLVRFFIQFSDGQTQKQMSNVIRALLDVEVVAAKPLQKQYKCYVDFELAKDYALPICDFQEKAEINLIDRIVATIAGSGIAIEVTAQGDRRAAVSIRNYVYEKIHPQSSISKAVLDQAVDMLSDVSIGRNTKGRRGEQTLRSGQQYRNDPWIKEVIKNAELKLHSSLFTCQVKIYGDSLEKIQAAKITLPAFINHFKIFRIEKKPSNIEALRKPSRHSLRNILLSRLWWIMPFGILLLAGFFGVFNPIRFVSSFGLTGDLGPLGLALFLSAVLYVVFRKRQPIVLSAHELSQIVGLPTAVGKLSVAIGQVPPTRMQLGSEEAPSCKLQEGEQTFNLKNEKLKQKISKSTIASHSLFAAESEEEPNCTR